MISPASETVHTSSPSSDQQFAPMPPARPEAGECAQLLPGVRPDNAVHGIEPVDGWWLIYDEHWAITAPSWAPREYAAVRGAERRRLGVSRFRFEPTQDRFAWLVRNGFPSMLVRAGGVATPLTDADIDAMLIAPGEAA